MRTIGKKTKRIIGAVVVIAVIGVIAKFGYSFLFLKYPYFGTAKEQTSHITRILSRDSVEAEVKMCERMHSKIHDPETTKYLLKNLKLETLHTLGEGASDGSLRPWYGFFFTSILMESDGFGPMTERLTRELETGNDDTVRMVATILPAMIHKMNWKAWSAVKPGSIAADLLEKDRSQWQSLLNTFFAKAQATPGTQGAADSVLVFIAERNDEHNIKTPTHLSVNSQLLEGPVGDALVELLGKWNNPERGEAATRLMSAMMRVGGRKSGLTDEDYKTDGSWAVENNERIGQALERELVASLEKGPPAHVGAMLIELVRARNRPVSEEEALRLEQILLDGEVPLTPRALRAVTLGSKRSPGAELLSLLDSVEDPGKPQFKEPFAPFEEYSKLDILATVPEWAPALAEAAIKDRNRGQEAIHHLSGLVRRLGQNVEQKELRDACIRNLGQRAFGEILENKYMEEDSMESLLVALIYVSPSEHRELRKRIEAQVLPRVKNGRISIPKTPRDMREEIIKNMVVVNPETSLYEICLAHYEKLPTDYKWPAAYSAARAVNAPKATEFFIRVFSDETLAAKKRHRPPFYSHDFLMQRLKLPLTGELVEAIRSSTLVNEQEKRSFLNRARKN